MTGGVLIEHSHRLLASLVGFCTILISILFFRTEHRKVALFALVLVIVQGVLGGLTVIYKLPPLISTAHLGIAMVFFCCLIFLYQRHKNKNLSSPPFWKLATVLIYFQILLGALIRHLGGGTACGLGADNMILCQGSLWPHSNLAALHLFHRFLGIIAGLLIVAMATIAANRGRLLYGPFLMSLVLLQIWLGLEIINTGLKPLVTMLHLGGATLLLGLLWKENFTPRSP